MRYSITMSTMARRLTSAFLASTALTGLGAAAAGELPKGGTVASGSVGISTPGPNTMTLKQSTSTAIVNWQSFSIGQGSRVDVVQPSASSALLNRVTGDTPSTIAGTLRANGQVYLVNPNGIAITKSGVVRAGAFVASSLGIGDDDFVAGKRTFRGNGASAAVTNKGAIAIGRGGYAALIGGEVENAGRVSVPLGKVGLGAGERATLDVSGDGFLQVAVPSGTSREGALIRQSGRIRAQGGRIEMRAATAREAARHAINLSGVVEARSVSGRSGAIVLGGGAGGRVSLSGRLDARSSGRAGVAAKGGAITVTGNDIRLAGARLDARGLKGGGAIRVGGDLKGGGTLPRAATTTVDRASTLTADATGRGRGGSVVVWSDGTTSFDGRISARGGPSGGDGGSAEVSGRSLLLYHGKTDLSAKHGSFGTLLLDPYDVVISNAATANGSLQSGTFTPTGPSTLDAATLSAALNTANVTVTTGGADSPGREAGDISVASSLTWEAPTTLTLSAFRNIVLGADSGQMNLGDGANLVLRADNSGTGSGTVSVLNGYTIVPGTGSAVSIFYNPASNPAGSAVNGTSYTGANDFTNLVAGPAFVTAYMLVNTANDLQNMRNNPEGFYALGRSIDASQTAQWNNGAGFDPIGTPNQPFTGALNGQGRTISRLTINRPGQDGIGLFGATANASLSGIVLAGASIRGGNEVGALVGRAGPGTAIADAAASGDVRGVSNVGGLVGLANNAQIATSQASGPVTGSSDPLSGVGGLVGRMRNESSVAGSFASGPVAGGGAGGLVGVLECCAAVTDSYATGRVKGSTGAGGLVGVAEKGAAIARAYATGYVTGTSDTGGLVGSGPAGIATDAYWDSQTTGQSTSAAGTPRSTAALQASLPADFDPAVWGVLPGQSYPYLTWRFPRGPLVVSGFVGGTGAGAGAAVGLAAGGTLRGSTNAGANRYYNIATDPLGPSAPRGVTTFLDLAAGKPRGSATTDAPAGAGSVRGLDIKAGEILIRSTQPTWTGMVGLLDSAGDSSLSSNIPYAVASASAKTALPVTFGSGLDLVVDARNTTGFTANDRLAADGSVRLASAGTLTVSSAGGIESFNRNVVVETPRFINRSGADAIKAGGRFLVYSQDYAADRRGGIVAGNLYNRTLASPPGTIAQAGNLFIYRRQPVATVTVANATRVVGAAPLTFTLGISGLVNGDTAAQAAAGVPSVTDTTALTAGPGLYPNAIEVGAGTLVSPIGYAFTFEPAPLAVVPPPAVATLLASLPDTSIALPNPTDEINLTGGGGSSGGGPTLGTGLGRGTRDAALAALAYLEEVSTDLERYVSECERRLDRKEIALAEYKACVADALERYADNLDRRILELPQPFRGISATIREAARRVRAAGTIEEARGAVRTAVVAVRKAIALLKADEPEVARIQVRQGNTIASALSSVETKLAKATGL